MNLKVTFSFIATEEDWDIASLLENCEGGIHSDEAIEIIRTALMEDATYVIKHASISLKQDQSSL